MLNFRHFAGYWGVASIVLLLLGMMLEFLATIGLLFHMRPGKRYRLFERHGFIWMNPSKLAADVLPSGQAFFSAKLLESKIALVGLMSLVTFIIRFHLIE